MPTYEYTCRSCHEVIEAFQSMRDAPLTVCPKCGKPTLKRMIGRGAGIIFKGSGFYETDYKRAAAPAGEEKAGKSEGAASAGSSSGSSTTPAPAKPASPPAKTD